MSAHNGPNRTIGEDAFDVAFLCLPCVSLGLPNLCRFCVLNSICGFSILLSIVLLPFHQGCEYQQRLNGRATENRTPNEVTFSMHRFSKMRVVSKFFAARAVAFGFFRITSFSVFGICFLLIFRWRHLCLHLSGLAQRLD